MKYSVKPVFGVLAPNESVKIFVRSDNWISPQDKFLLQSVALIKEEELTLDSRSWKCLDAKRFIENYIPCSPSSALSMREPELEDDAAVSSSSSSVSSVAAAVYTPPSTAYDLARPTGTSNNYYYSSSQQRRTSNSSSSISNSAPPRQHQQHMFEHWPSPDSMMARPTVSIGGLGLGRRLSASSSTCSSATSSPGSYPTLFTASLTSKSFDQLPSPILTAPASPVAAISTTTVYSSKRSSSSSNWNGKSSIIASIIKEEDSGSVDMDVITDGTSRASQSMSTSLKDKALCAFDAIRSLAPFSKMQLLMLLLTCLLFGMLMPLGQMMLLFGGDAGYRV
ncbi:hypothetical protein EDD11_003031 [Mortierella claussenii]|nr:hypothetical protein EDD11_003031 [Mortierella claussenii]